MNILKMQDELNITYTNRKCFIKSHWFGTDEVLFATSLDALLIKYESIMISRAEATMNNAYSSIEALSNKINNLNK